MMKSLLLAVIGVLVGAIALLVLFFLWARAPRYPWARQIEQTRDGAARDAWPETLTVVSYNLGYLSGLTNNQPVARSRSLYDQNQQQAIAALAAVDADLIALQEVDIDARRSFYVNQVQALATGLRYPETAIALNWNKRYVPFPPWPVSVQFGPLVSGQAVLSQLPITNHQRQVLDRVASQPFFYNALYLERLAQVVQVSGAGRSLVLINVHLEAFDAPTRLRQTRFVRSLAEDYARQQPVILLGDFNSALNRPQEGDPRSITELLSSEALRPVVVPDQWLQPDQLTFPADQPQYKLDYIFYTPRTLERLDARVVTEAAQASDHLPLVARFRWR